MTSRRFGLSPRIAALLAIPISSLFPQPSGVAAPPALPPAVPGTACQPAAVAAALLARESAILGRTHAEEHARMRGQQCEAERGLRPIPARGAAVSGQQSLQEDRGLIAAADAMASPGPGKPVVSPASATKVNGANAQGSWSAPFVIPVVGITSVLLNTGKVLFWSYEPTHWMDPASSNTGVAYLWDPATRTGHAVTPPENIWCGGQTILADGRVFVAGGNLRYPDPNAPAGTTGWEGTITTYTYVPGSEHFVKQPDMDHGRWYPTTTRLADNRVVITTGYDDTGSQALNLEVELFTASADPEGVGSIASAGTNVQSGVYPLQYLLQDGRMLMSGPGAYTNYVYDPGANTWTLLPKMRNDRWGYGNGVIFTDATGATLRQVVMVAGGLSNDQAVSTNEWTPGSNPAAGWSAFPQWLQPRHNSNTVILPDGHLLTVGGNRGGTTYGDPLLETEMYNADPTVTGGQWQAMAPHAIQAAYHSSAILLPDATVLLSQDDMDTSAAAAARHKAQVYSPPYLFKGNRPAIVSSPTSVARGQSFSVTSDRSVSAAMLIAPGATTHGNDMHQRAIRLPVTPTKNGLTATVPASANVVPSGHYMLFVLNSSGVPSAARFVQVS